MNVSPCRRYQCNALLCKLCKMNVFERLPTDLQLIIRNFIQEERHVLARLLLRNKAFVSRSDYSQHLHLMISYWSSIVSLKIIDKTLKKAAIFEHDSHYQYCEWQPGENGNDYFSLFHQLENILSKIVHNTSK